jgi:DNA polymerase-3 subunit epsilon
VRVVPSAGSPLRRSLDELREEGGRVRVEALAARLLAMAEPANAELARRLVAAALERTTQCIPDELGPEDLRPADELALASLRFDSADFVVVDLETTGLGPDATILEIGAIAVSRLALGERFEALIRPPLRLSPRIVDLTGITDDLAAQGRDAGEVVGSFRSWLARFPRAVVVAHNAQFDVGFLRRAFASHGLRDLDAPVLCTRKLARRLLPALRVYSLDSLCAAFGVSNRARHRALGDALATAQALLWLLPLAREISGEDRLGALFDLQRRPVSRRRRKRRSGGARRSQRDALPGSNQEIESSGRSKRQPR